MKHPIAEAVDTRVAQSLMRVESKIDYRPVKIAAWGVAAASVLGAVAAGFGAVAAVAGAYVAVRSAIRVSRAPEEERDGPSAPGQLVPASDQPSTISDASEGAAVQPLV